MSDRASVDRQDRESGRGIDRRGFLRQAGAAAIAAGGLSAIPAIAAARPLVTVLGERKPAAAPAKAAEDYVRILFESLKPEQREKICFPFGHPLRRKVNNNWHIVPQKIGEFLDSDQQELCRRILRGITTEDGFERFQRSMKDDAGGLGEYSCALFGDPTRERHYQWVLTGRHVTLRADGNTTANTAFGGPIFYGHAVTFNEKPDHPGNVWWHQARLANELFAALDGAQRKKALFDKSPADSPVTVSLRGHSPLIPGVAGAEMSADQKELLKRILKSMLSMFRKSDVEEVVESIKRGGGLDAARISFYRQNDLGGDGIWDRWRVEGPSFVWYFRGSPHVHTWVNVANHAPKWL